MTGDFITEQEIKNALYSDAALAIVATLLIVLFTWWILESLFLAVVGVFEIVLAFPIVYFVTRVIMSIAYVGFLTPMTLFIIIGIGVDDIYIFHNFWSVTKFNKTKQQKEIFKTTTKRKNFFLKKKKKLFQHQNIFNRKVPP